MAKCDYDCLHCIYDDCILDDADDLTEEELQLSQKMDWKAQSADPKSRSSGSKSKAYYWAHREEICLKRKRKYAENREEITAAQRARYAADPEKYLS